MIETPRTHPYSVKAEGVSIVVRAATEAMARRNAQDMARIHGWRCHVYFYNQLLDTYEGKDKCQS